PGADRAVEVLRVAGAGLDRSRGIAARVDPVADLEPVRPRGPRHELPDPAGTDARAGRVVEAALDHRDADEIPWKSLAHEGGVEQLAIAGGPAQPARHHRASLWIVLEVVEVP